jgi:hypothetical protein
MFADAFAGIAVGISAAMGGPYHASVAHWPGTPVYDNGGSIISPGAPIAKACLCQVDAATEAMRSEAGYVDRDVALIVLVSTLDAALNTDAEIEVTAGPSQGRYSVQSVGLDPMGSHWVCRGRRA